LSKVIEGDGVEVTNNDYGDSQEHAEEGEVLPSRKSELGMTGPNEVANPIGDSSNDNNRSQVSANPKEGFAQYTGKIYIQLASCLYKLMGSSGREGSFAGNDGESRRTPPVSQDHPNLLSSLSRLPVPSASTHPDHKVHKLLYWSDNQIILPHQQTYSCHHHTCPNPGSLGAVGAPRGAGCASEATQRWLQGSLGTAWGEFHVSQVPQSPRRLLYG
jgi:hypothetical protein